MSAVETMPRADAIAPPAQTIPPLENGSRLSQPEFHRLYENSPEIRKAELVEGVVYIMSSPVSLHHAEPHAAMVYLLSHYAFHTKNVRIADNGTLLLDNENEVQPDIMLRIVESKTGARSRVIAKGYVGGTPELVAEIAVSSASLDLGDKFRAYQRNGIQEYLVWRVQENRIDWWQRVDGVYQLILPDASGITESRVFPGLRIATNALVAGDNAAALGELQMGLAGDAHRAFAASLA